MKTLTPFHFAKHHGIALGCAFALLISTAFITSLSAAEYILTPTSPIPASGGFAANDVFRISGTNGSVTLANGATLGVNEWVAVGAYDVRSGRDITFKQEDVDTSKWALLQNNAGTTRIMRYEATRTSLNLDRVILGNIVYNNTGGAIYVASTGATTNLVINGDTIFTNIRATNNGAGISVQNGSLTFTGTVIFDQNRAGYTDSTGAFSLTHNGGAIYSAGADARCVLTFENSAFFFSNTAANTGGAIYANTSSSLVFEKDATFIGNTARAGTAALGGKGGAITFNANASGGEATFSGDTLFEKNRGASDGGAIYTTSNGRVTFDGAGKTVTLKDNFSGAAGGAIMGGAVDFSAGYFSVSGNSAVLNGGALRVNNKLTISNGVFDISNNHAGNAGGALNVGTLEIAGSGTFSGNISGTNGGAIVTGNASITSMGGIAFSNNTAGGLGGAIDIGGQAQLALDAAGGDIVFEGNTSGAVINSSQLSTGDGLGITAAGASNAIHFNAATGTLALNATAGKAVRFHDAISTSSTTALTVNKTGAGSVVFRNHTYDLNATTTVEEGVFQLSNGAIYGASNSTGSFDLKSGAILSVNGQLRAGNVNIANGATLEAIEGGIFSINTASSVSIGTGLTLAGSGTLSLGAPLNASKIRVGSGTPGAQTLTLTDNVTLANGANIEIDLYSGIGGDGYGLSDRINLAGSSITLAGKNRIDIGTVQSGSFNLGNIGSLYGNITLTINGEVPATVGRQSGALSRNGSNLVLIASADMSRKMTWTGTGGNNVWDLVSENWTNFAGVTRFGGGDRVTFSGTADTPASRNIEIGVHGVKVSDMWFSGNADYTFSGSGGITADPSYILEFGGTSAVNNPEGKLVKRGTGTLTFANTHANVFTGGIDIYGGAIAFNNPEQLGTGGAHITFVDSGTLKATGTVTLAGSISVADGKTAALHGSGTHLFTYAGILSGTNATLATAGGVLFAGSADIATLEVTSGAMGIAGNIKASNAVNIAARAHLYLPSTASLTGGGSTFTMTNKGNVHIGKAATAPTYSKVTLNGNYASDGGNLILALGADPTGNIVLCDEFNVTGNVSGTVNIRFDQQTAIRDVTDWSNVKPLTTPDPATVTGTIICTPVELTNGLIRTMVRNSDGTWTYTQNVSPTLPLLLGVDAASIMIGKASMTSLSQRLVTNRAIAPHKLQVWVNGLMTDEEIKLNFYRGSKVTSQGAQVGADWSAALGDGRIVLGAFYDYANSTMYQESQISRRASTETKASGYGVYGTYTTGKWYVDMLARTGVEDYDIKVPGNPTFSTDGDSTGGSIEVGRTFIDVDGQINWEPQAQLTYQKHKINNATDYLDRHYNISSADSLEGRLGVRIWLERELKQNWKIVPYLRTSYLYEFKGDTQIVVADRIYNNDLGGSKGIVDLGIVMQIGRNFGVNAKGSYSFGERTKGFSLDLGCGFFW